MNSLLLIAIVSGLAALGAAIWAVIERGRATAATTELRLVRAQAEENRTLLQAQTAQTASEVADALVRRSNEAFEAQERLAQAKLEAQLKPVAETLAKMQEQVASADRQRAAQASGLTQQIEQLMVASVAARDEAKRLAQALRGGAGVQGRWAEQTLRNVLEAAGLANRFDFQEQVTTQTEEGRRRPDVVVRMPGGGLFVIDAKCPPNAYFEAQDAADDAARDIAYGRLSQIVRGHVQSLSAKAYWDQFKAQGSPDFVAMFMPSDAFLSAAVEKAPDLLTEAMDRRVLIVTPTTLFALCKAVAYGWRVEDQARGAARIAELGRELYRRIAVMGGHAARMGRALDDAAKRYNEFAGSLESQVLTQARRFEELSADHEARGIATLPPIETAIRPLAKLTRDEAA
jgi:DNA recombination protein RmuC